MRRVGLALGSLLAIAGVGAADYDPDEWYQTSVPLLFPPSDYYFHPAENKWYYYDGLTLTPQPGGFVPPPAQRHQFDVRPITTQSGQEGWEIYIDMNFIGSHQLHWRVESRFGTADSWVCHSQSQSLAQYCLDTATVSTGNFIIPGAVLGVINEYRLAKTKADPLTGTAEAWAWLDDEPQTLPATYHDGPITW